MNIFTQAIGNLQPHPRELIGLFHLDEMEGYVEGTRTLGESARVKYTTSIFFFCWLTHFIFNKIIFNNIFFYTSNIVARTPFFLQYSVFFTSFQARYCLKILKLASH